MPNQMPYGEAGACRMIRRLRAFPVSAAMSDYSRTGTKNGRDYVARHSVLRDSIVLRHGRVLAYGSWRRARWAASLSSRSRSRRSFLGSCQYAPSASFPFQNLRPNARKDKAGRGCRRAGGLLAGRGGSVHRSHWGWILHRCHARGQVRSGQVYYSAEV